jgi:hypothetical protein
MDLNNSIDLLTLDSDSHHVIYTENEVRVKGLRILGWSEQQIDRIQNITADDRLRADFGANPHIIAQLWEDLQTTPIDAARIDPEEHPIDELFRALFFLRCYPTEKQAENKWHISENTLRRATWYFVKKIGALKPERVVWPEDNFGDDIWALSVDGTHFRTVEPNHPDLPKDKSYFSFKHHCAGTFRKQDNNSSKTFNFYSLDVYT